MKPASLTAASALAAILLLDLLIFPNCSPVNTPDQGPVLLRKGEWEARLGLQFQYGTSALIDSGSFGLGNAGWTLSMRRGLGGGREIGARLILGNLFFLPNGLEAAYSRDLGRFGEHPAALNMALGWSAIQWDGYYSGRDRVKDPFSGLWHFMPSLAVGSERFHAGPAFAATLDWPHVLLLGGGWIGGDFGPGPRLEGMAIGSAKGPRLALSASGQVGD